MVRSISQHWECRVYPPLLKLTPHIAQPIPRVRGLLERLLIPRSGRSQDPGGTMTTSPTSNVGVSSEVCRADLTSDWRLLGFFRSTLVKMEAKYNKEPTNRLELACWVSVRIVLSCTVAHQYSFFSFYCKADTVHVKNIREYMLACLILSVIDKN